MSSDSPHHFGGESPFVSIICINSRLSFNMESQYSPYWLLRRVTTSLLIYSGESLLTAESYFQKLPLPLKGHWSKKWTIHGEYCSSRTFQKSKKYGLPKALFLTPRNWQWGVDFFYNLSLNNSPKIWKILKSLLGMSIETRINRLVKKRELKNWTVPLISQCCRTSCCACFHSGDPSCCACFHKVTYLKH